jgi:DNA-binding CsgD family transcriptional regulator
VKNIEVVTAKEHVGNIFRKLGARIRAQAALPYRRDVTRP